MCDVAGIFRRNSFGFAHKFLSVKSYREEAGKDRVVGVYAVDADNVDELVALIEKVQPALVINVALPYQDLPIMDACLATGVHYLDTAKLRAKRRSKIRIQLAVGLS